MQNNAYKKQLIWNFNTNELLDIFLKDGRISMQLWEIKKKEVWKELDLVMTKNLFARTSPTKYLEQFKEIQENWTGLENFDIYFCVLFDCYCQSLISGSEAGH